MEKYQKKMISQKFISLMIGFIMDYSQKVKIKNGLILQLIKNSDQIIKLNSIIYSLQELIAKLISISGQWKELFKVELIALILY